MGAPPAACRRAPGVLARRLPQGWLVLAPEAEAPLLLSGWATTLWDELEMPRGRSELVDLLGVQVAGDPEDVAAAVGAGLDRLVDAGCVVEGPAR